MRWTEAHRFAALRRTYEIAADLAKEGDWIGSGAIAGHAWDWASSETDWRENLKVRFDAERIEREVVLVNEVATGKKTWEEAFR